MRSGLLALLAALIACAMGMPAMAAELIVNGNFSTISVDRSSIFGTDVNTVNGGIIRAGDGNYQTVQGWKSAGYNFVFKPGDADTIGAISDDNCCTLKLYGPGNGAANGLTTSPLGGNFIAADGAYLNAPLYQELPALVAGQVYKVTFYWAAAQQATFPGGTTEQWKVCLGTCNFTFPGGYDGLANYTSGEVHETDIVSNPHQGFVPWQYEEFYFTAQSSLNQKLSFLAAGTPNGQPPFVLLDGVSMQSVPEPTTWSMMVLGFGIVGASMRKRRGGLRRQIV